MPGLSFGAHLAFLQVVTQEFWDKPPTEDYRPFVDIVHSLGRDNLLSVMSERGQLGMYHDWCVQFIAIHSIFPRQKM